MKRIVDGVTYNTDTSTLVAQGECWSRYNHEQVPAMGYLYQTRGGAYFVLEEFEIGKDENDEPIMRSKVVPHTAEDAQKWLMTGDVEVFHNPFEDPPEAAAEQEASATIYVRVPQSLKQRLDAAAKADGASGNAWSIRCIERCLTPHEETRKSLGLVWWLAKTIADNNEGFSPDAIRAMAASAADEIERAWRGLGFAEGRFDQDISDLAVSNDYGREVAAITAR